MQNKTNDITSHLQDLRQTLIRCFKALGAVLPITLCVSPQLLDFLIKILLANSPIALNFFSPLEVFVLQIKISFITTLLITSPYLARQIWNFILPGLYENERHFIKSITLISSTLFITGVIFCLLCILPAVIRFGLSFSTPEIKAVLGISNIISLSLKLSVIFGIMFQFPLITCSLIKSDLVSYETIKSKRPHIFVLILIISALLTPPDIISQIMLALPTYCLFETGLYLSRHKKNS